jgi:hypothetical protein
LLSDWARARRAAAQEFDEPRMKHGEFKIGMEFRIGGGLWRVTDIGTRTVIAIRIDRVEIEGGTPGPVALNTLDRMTAEAEGWFEGPPYAVVETVLDENDIEDCGPA